MAGSNEHDNETSDSIGEEFLDRMRYYQPLTNDCSMRLFVKSDR